jgi:hypothetical protein
MPEAHSSLWSEGFAQADPTVTPEPEFATPDKRQSFIFGLHECAISTVINQHESLVAALDSGVIARRIFAFDDEIHVITSPEDYGFFGGQNEMTVVPIKHKL